LAALGINTFFSGDAAGNLDVSAILRQDPTKFAASRGGIGADAGNAERLANLLDTPLDALGGGTLAELYDRVAGETAQRASVARSVADGFRVFHKTLEGQKLATSGVSLDEEAIKMIGYQRLFQASARFIATISELLDTLVKL
jgi:flagellar hook-associated protein 1 FlgK